MPGDGYRTKHAMTHRYKNFYPADIPLLGGFTSSPTIANNANLTEYREHYSSYNSYVLV